MQVKKALITAAGYGTRFFPITKTVQKEMIPVLNKPTIDYVVDDCIKAGIEEIVFVIKPNDTQIRHYYRENKRLYEYLERMNKLEKYEQVKKLHEKADFSFVFQNPEDTYGTATPVKLGRELLQDEDAFLVFMGDDFVYHADGSSEAKYMIENFQAASDTSALASFVEKPKDELYKYGIADCYEEEGINYLKTIVEKPEPGTETSNIANISKYIFTPEIFDIIEKQDVDSVHGELFITDSLTTLAETKKVVAHTTKGKYLDTGSLGGWLEANLILASKDDELKKKIIEVVNNFE